MDLFNYVEPVSTDVRHPRAKDSLFYQVSFFELLPKCDVAHYPLVFIGITDERNSSNKGVAASADAIREYLYSLFLHGESTKILDLGNIIVGKTVNDTYRALHDVLEYVVKTGSIPIVLGSSQDMAFPIAKLFGELCPECNITVLDSRLDVGGDDDFHNLSVMRKVMTEIPSARLAFLGGQAYLIPKYDMEYVLSRRHTVARLGKIRDNMTKIEPIVRDSDIFICDIGAIRQCDAPGNAYASPNGLNAEEACQIARYAGISERSSLFFLCEYNCGDDRNGQTAHVSAQLIWHFIDGVTARKGDYPLDSLQSMQKYFVSAVDSELNLTFYRSTKTDRWWIVTSEDAAGNERLVSCNYEDYLCACKNVIPDVYLDEISRLMKS